MLQTRMGGDSTWALQDHDPVSGPEELRRGSPRSEVVTIDGYTTPGSIVLVDSKDGTYSFASQALPTDARGFFTVSAAASGK